MLANLSLRYKFFLPIIGIIVLMGAVLTVLISQRAYENARKDALILAMEMADNCRNAVRSELQGARITAETLSSVIEALKEMDLTDREMMNNILKHTLSKKEYITAFCVAFAPDALDGKDKEFSNKEPHYAASGRYAPYWNKLEGSIAVEPLPDSDLDDTTGADWWTEPRSTKREMITDPYPYQVQGKDVMLTSLIFPVINKDEVIGIVASDIVLDKLQELASKVNPNNKGGTTAIFSNNSAVVAHPDKRFLGKDISEVIVCRMLDKHRDFVKIAIKTSEKYIAEKPVEATEEEIEKYGNAKKFLASLKQYAADLEETKLAVESLNPELAKAILNSFPAFRNYVDDVGSSIQNNKQYIFADKYLYTAYIPIQFSEETKPWTVAITVPMTSVLQSAVTMRNYVIANFVIFALIITLCLYFMTGKITKPIFQLVKSAGQIGHGNFDAEIPQFNQKDEIGTLSDAFRAMVRELQRRAEELIGKNERLGRLNEIKDEFLANTSHELRTPINGIIGIVESMMDGAVGELSDEQKYNLAVVANSGRRLSHLVNDILDFTKLKNREIELQLKSLDLYTVVDIVVMLSKPLIKNKDLVIVNDVGYSLPLIKADENRIQQILYNLIGNAVKFTEKGNVTISAEVQGNEVAVHIKDTGIGIEEKSYEKIFESFEQADGSTAREYGGSGLGLSITKKIVELHGGKITVESKIGSGSVFTFTIPVSTEQDAEEIDAEKTRITVDIEQKLIANTNPLESGVSVQPSDGKQRPRILTVDDEPVNIQVLFNMLSMCDFSVEKAFNGQEALELFEKGERFDLVLLDVMMPKLSGYDVCKRLRKTHSLLDLPIIMLTAKNQIQDVILGFRSGANDYVSKPFEKDVLIARINTLLELKTAMTAAEAAIKAKTLFLANMSHELRTPLNAVVGLTELLKNTSMDNTQRYYIDKMHQATLVLLALIENILDFSKIEAGKTRLQRSAFDLRKMFEYLKDLCRSHHSESPVKLVIDIDRDIPDVLLSDQERLQQILINLISNAYKFTEKGTITIKSELVRSDPNNVEISFSVSDTGIGMSPEQLEKIFAVFEQADTTSTRKYGGVGIGLTLARELVGLFGGTITVKSKEGVGTAFSFTIVFQIPESGSVSEAELYDAGKEPHDYVSDTTLKGMKVMLVEDNKINQMIAAELLKRVGVIVTTAANGQIALEKLMEARNIQSKDKPFDLILMDLQMPVMDGYEATKIIKGMPEYKDIPVYALTAHAFLEEQRRCFELGMEEHISKPINTKKLYDALRKAVLK